MRRHADHDYITVLPRVNDSLRATVDEQAAHIASQDQFIATQARTRQILDAHTAYLTAQLEMWCVRRWWRVLNELWTGRRYDVEFSDDYWAQRKAE